MTKAHQGLQFSPDKPTVEHCLGLPLTVYRRAVTNTHGRFEDRICSLQRIWRDTMSGTWPIELDWPSEIIQCRLAEWVSRNSILELCCGSEELVEQLLLDILNLSEKCTSKRNELIDSYHVQFWEEFWQSFVEQNNAVEYVPTTRLELIVWLHLFRAINVFVIENLCESVKDESVNISLSPIKEIWEERVSIWRQLKDMFGPLDRLLSPGWDLSAGIFKYRGWGDLKKYRDLIDRIPQIRQMIEELGRLQASEEMDDDPTYADAFNSLRRTTEEQREVEHPLARHQAQGIERSADFMRMIPSEAMLRRRPGLKRLWHAKLAERGLLTYRVRGTYVDRVSTEVEEQQPQSKKRIRGPIIVCVDTSGSMSGRPEAVAKALTLEACRIAHAEQRPCLLFSFSGSGQYVEHELSLSPDGLQSLLEFLTMNFDGGTDISTPFEKALARLRTAEWERADILLVSDGAFSKSQVDALKPALDDAKKRLGLRVSGLLVGNYSSGPMNSLCQPLISVNGW